MKKRDSRRALTAFAAVVAFAASCNLQASAQAAPTIMSHQVIASPAVLAQAPPDKLSPYVCNATGGPHEQTSQYVNRRHMLLQVSVPKQNQNFDCANAGGVVPFSTPPLFQSISVMVKTIGDVALCNDIDFLFTVSGDPTVHGTCLTNSQKGGTTSDGYTLYTLNGSSTSFNNLPLTSAGVSVSRHPARPDVAAHPGLVYFDRFKVNTVEIPKSLPTQNTCPFSFCP